MTPTANGTVNGTAPAAPAELAAEPPPVLGDDVRRVGSGAVCPACRLSQLLGVPHACIAGNPAHPNGAGSDLRPLMYAADVEQWSRLLRDLNHHPAAPRSGPFALRDLDATWCVCQHEPTRPAGADTGQ